MADLKTRSEVTRDSLGAIGDVLGAIGRRDFELQPILELLVERAADLCEAGWGYLWMRDGEEFRAVANHGASQASWDYEQQHPIRPGRTSLVGRVALEGRAILIPDVLADPEYEWAEGQKLAGHRTALGLPIHGDGSEVIGVIGLARTEVAPFDDEEIGIVSVFADQAAVAVRLAGLLGDTHEALERETAIGQVLQSITRSTFELDAVLQTVLDSAVRLTHADQGNILREVGGYFRARAFSSDVPEEFREIISAIAFQPERGSAMGRALLERGPVQIVDVLADPEYRLHDAQRIIGFRTLLAAPLLRDGEPIGVLSVWRRQVQAFTAPEINLLTTFADQAVLAIENVRLFETIDRQRTELARYAPQAAELLSSDEGEQLLAGHRREITALFCDLRGFTAFAETAEPEEVLGLLREYHAAVGELAVANGGTVEHFAGDGLMVFFNDPAKLADHQLAAARAALAMGERFAPLALGWRKRGYELGLGIGLAAGYATLGRIGFEGRYDYGAVGNVVILASRLSEAAIADEILVSQRLHAAIEAQIEAEEVDPLQLKGFSRPMSVYRVRGLRT
jgi:class 3 adenylate cyclase/putative methionine-R-sulfoxide reductase with GAF domain